LDYGVTIDKLDSHMHLHLLPGLFQIVLDLARQYRIAALRYPKERILGRGTFPGLVGLSRRAILTSLAMPRAHRISMAGLFYPDHFSGVAESGRLTEDDLLRILQHLRPGVTEVMVHPGYRDTVLDGWPQSRRYAREQEVRALTSPRVKALVEGHQIKIVSYPTIVKGRMTPRGGDGDAPF
jgi:chitin disaccharide deacetylase